jgi:hypothetical protein
VVEVGEYVDFKAIKSAASVGAVAARYGVELRRVNSSHERAKCPLPTHPAGDEKETFSVNAEKQVWICHSTICAKARRGRKGGDVIELVAAMESCSLREAGIKLGQWFLVSDAPAKVPERKEKMTVDVSCEIASGAVTASDGEKFGGYAPLAKWIEKRLSGGELSRFEQSAYLSILGKIEELAETKT